MSHARDAKRRADIARALELLADTTRPLAGPDLFAEWDGRNGYYRAMRSFVERGIVGKTREEGDDRRLRYFLPDAARPLVEQALERPEVLNKLIWDATVVAPTKKSKTHESRRLQVWYGNGERFDRRVNYVLPDRDTTHLRGMIVRVAHMGVIPVVHGYLRKLIRTAAEDGALEELIARFEDGIDATSFGTETDGPEDTPREPEEPAEDGLPPVEDATPSTLLEQNLRLTAALVEAVSYVREAVDRIASDVEELKELWK